MMDLKNIFLKGLFLSAFFLGCSDQEERISEPQIFEWLSPDETGITFNNLLTDTEKFNILEYLYYYNGGGVAIGDIDNDGLSDIYFTSNQNDNKLYRNLGDMRFEDITESAGVTGDGDWTTGVTMADVNGDGLLDIYVSQLSSYKGIKGKNQLFINNGDQTFTDRAEDYGLDFEGFSTQASFFDYDNDGDLDMYLLNHAVHTRRSYGRSTLRLEKNERSGDRLYRNDIETTQKFVDVTESTGIYSSHIGYGLSAGVSDINNDGCLDIYVCNDFHENDYLYINNCDGTFTERLEESLGHSSRFSMGNDIADFNNDGLMDIITLDMLPDDEEVLKISAGEESNEVSDIKLQFGYYYQLARNTLQLNRGNGLFSDIALMASVYATDWSWSPLIADYDNDGTKDIFITNGIYRRPNDLDYINYMTSDQLKGSGNSYEESGKTLIDLMPINKVSNRMFKNTGDYSFSDVGMDWGIGQESFSNGAAYGDLDNDGDLDVVVNNINEAAFIYENLSSQMPGSNYLAIKLLGDKMNTMGVGAKVTIEVNGEQQIQELIPTRGFLSSIDNKLIFGLDTNQIVDKVTVTWPGGKFQESKNISSNQVLILDQKDASQLTKDVPQELEEFFVEDITESSGILFHHLENTNFKDYNREYLIPHKLSTQGPKMAVGDVNSDGLSDLFIGGGKGQSAALFIQREDGTFFKSDQKAINLDKPFEDIDATFVDSDSDGDLDLYVVSGGNQSGGRDFFLRDRIYLNNGNGYFSLTNGALPDIFANGSCVAAADYDNDGDVDLFVGTRSIAGQYGKKPPSYLLVNDGSGRFNDRSDAFAPDLMDLGMVTDAVWVDYDLDNDLDLMVVGEWMPVTLLENEGGQLLNVTQKAGLGDSNGWWNTIVESDIDKDGDVDFIAGNLGWNTKLRATESEPSTLYLKDFDQNDRPDPIISYYKDGDNVPFPTRDELIKQIASLKKKFPSYKDYGRVRTINDLFDRSELSDMEESYAYTFASSLIINNGDGTFSLEELSVMAQISPVMGAAFFDYDQDGAGDLLLGQNFYGSVVNFGRYDAGYGILLKGDGSGHFTEVDNIKSEVLIKGEVRDMVILENSRGEELVVISKNDAPVQVVRSSKRHFTDIEIP